MNSSQNKSLVWKRWIVAAWTVVHLYLASHRSIWMDELYRFRQLQLPAWDALKSLMGEPSPFAPGEMVADLASRFLFSGWMSFEFWARLPSVLLGALALWTCFELSWIAGWLAFFSVALTTFSTQARPYAALMASGAVAFAMLWRREDAAAGFSLEESTSQSPRAAQVPRAALAPSSMDSLRFWFTLFFAHIYGICFLGLAAALCKQWRRVAGATAYLAAILIVHHFAPRNELPYWTASFPPLTELLRQAFGVLSNPNKMALFLGPLFVAGFFYSHALRRSYKSTAVLGLFFIATMGAPVGANLIGKYIFFPRQVMGAWCAYLVIAALGLAWIQRSGLRAAAAGALITLQAIAWSKSILFGIGPFSDQPLHRYKDRAAELIQNAAAQPQSVLLIDPAGMVPHYLTQILGTPPGRQQVEPSRQRSTIPIDKHCWPATAAAAATAVSATAATSPAASTANAPPEGRHPICVYSIEMPSLVYDGPTMLERSEDFRTLASSGFSAIIHGFNTIHLSLPATATATADATAPLIRRTW